MYTTTYILHSYYTFILNIHIIHSYYTFILHTYIIIYHILHTYYIHITYTLHTHYIHITYYMLHITCWMLHIIIHITYYILHITYYILHITYYIYIYINMYIYIPTYGKPRVAAWSFVHKMYDRKSVHCKVEAHLDCSFARICVNCIVFVFSSSLLCGFFLRGGFGMPKNQRLHSLPFSHFPTPASRNCDRFCHAAPCVQPALLFSTWFFYTCWCNAITKSMRTLHQQPRTAGGQSASNVAWRMCACAIERYCPTPSHLIPHSVRKKTASPHGFRSPSIYM